MGLNTYIVPPLKMNSFQIVNGSQLPAYADKKVSVTGFVNTVSQNSLSFELRSVDNVMIKVNLKKPISEPFEGYVEVSYARLSNNQLLSLIQS